MAPPSSASLFLSQSDADLDPLTQALRWREAGHMVALATVVQTWGSSPCPPGSTLAVRGDGSMVGSVSGGCIEAAVVTAAQDVMRTRQPALLTFGVADEDAWAVGLACGGKISVHVDLVE